MAFPMKQGDTSPAIETVLLDENGDPVDLTGASVRFLMVHQSSETTVVDSPATVTNATGGEVKYEWASGDTDKTGTHLAEWEVTHSNGTVETFPNDGWNEVYVRPDLG